MENLFDLIFENFWVVLILFGIVSSMFGGDKKKQKQKPYSETTQMPTMRRLERSENQRTPQKHRDIKKVQEMTAAAMPRNTEQVKEELSDAQAYLAEKQAMLQRKAEQLRKKSANLEKVVDEKSTRGTFSQNEVVNGIIMAEILGAPRAKKPYSRARR